GSDRREIQHGALQMRMAPCQRDAERADSSGHVERVRDRCEERIAGKRSGRRERVRVHAPTLLTRMFNPAGQPAGRLWTSRSVLETRRPNHLHRVGRQGLEQRALEERTVRKEVLPGEAGQGVAPVARADETGAREYCEESLGAALSDQEACGEISSVDRLPQDFE